MQEMRTRSPGRKAVTPFVGAMAGTAALPQHLLAHAEYRRLFGDHIRLHFSGDIVLPPRAAIQRFLSRQRVTDGIAQIGAREGTLGCVEIVRAVLHHQDGLGFRYYFVRFHFRLPST